MSHTVSDIFKNFDYDNNKQKSQEVVEVIKYKGIQCGQANGFAHVLNSLFLKQSFKNVIELGTQNGGTSLFLNDLMKLYGGDNFITFDVNKCSAGVNQVVGDFLNDQNTINLVKTNIQKEGKTLLFCDGGDKNREFNSFSPFLNFEIYLLSKYAEQHKRHR